MSTFLGVLGLGVGCHTPGRKRNGSSKEMTVRKGLPLAISELSLRPLLGATWTLRTARRSKCHEFLGRALLRFSLKYGSFSPSSLKTGGLQVWRPRSM